MALIDDIKKSLQSGFQLPQFGQSEQVRQLQRAASGKLARETGAGPVFLAEQVAATAAEQQRQEDVLAGKVQAEQLTMQEKAQQEQFRQQNIELDEKLLNARLDMQNKVSNLLQEYSQRTGELDLRQESAKTQYLTAMMRLSNDDYLERLETEAAASRLQEQSAFEWELSQSIFDEEISLLKNDLAFRSAMAADARTFKEYLAEIDITQAIELAVSDAKARESAAQWQAAGQAVSGLARAGVAMAGTSNMQTTGTETVEFGDTTLASGGGEIAAPRPLATSTTTIPFPRK